MMNNELIPTPMMSFGESVKTCFQKYVTFKGRARRSEYWWFWLLNLIVSIVTLVLDYKLDMINTCSTSLSATLLPRRTDTARARSTHRRHSNL